MAKGRRNRSIRRAAEAITVGHDPSVTRSVGRALRHGMNRQQAAQVRLVRHPKIVGINKNEPVKVLPTRKRAAAWLRKG